MYEYDSNNYNNSLKQKKILHTTILFASTLMLIVTTIMSYINMLQNENMLDEKRLFLTSIYNKILDIGTISSENRAINFEIHRYHDDGVKVYQLVISETINSILVLYEENNQGYKSFPYLDNNYYYNYFDLERTKSILQNIYRSKMDYFFKKLILGKVEYYQDVMLENNISDKMWLLSKSYEIIFNLLLFVQAFLAILIVYLNYIAFKMR